MNPITFTPRPASERPKKNDPIVVCNGGDNVWAGCFVSIDAENDLWVLWDDPCGEFTVYGVEWWLPQVEITKPKLAAKKVQR